MECRHHKCACINVLATKATICLATRGKKQPSSIQQPCSRPSHRDELVPGHRVLAVAASLRRQVHNHRACVRQVTARAARGAARSGSSFSCSSFRCPYPLPRAPTPVHASSTTTTHPLPCLWSYNVTSIVHHPPRWGPRSLAPALPYAPSQPRTPAPNPSHVSLRACIRASVTP